VTARTSSVAEAAATVRAELSAALATIPGPGSPAIRTALTEYLAARQAERMVAEILGDSAAETPADVADPLRPRMVSDLAGRILGAVQQG
jgi:hypothetical protein